MCNHTSNRYVAKLDLMVHVFAIPLREHIAMCIAAGTPNSSCITENEHRRLFGAIESILMIHAGFQDPKDESKNEAGIHAELRAAWDAAEAASFKGGGVAKAVADVLVSKSPRSPRCILVFLLPPSPPFSLSFSLSLSSFIS